MTAAHWDDAYSNRQPETCGWYEASPSTLPDVVALTDPGSAVIDVGSGTGDLLLHLARLGYRDLTALDVSAEALRTARARAEAGAADIDFVSADVRCFEPNRQWDLWHDRAVFHFFVDANDRRAYRAALQDSVRPGGHAVIAAFDVDGPPSCAGLATARYSEATLAAEFSPELDCLACRQHRSSIEGSDRRPYVICRFERPTQAG